MIDIIEWNDMANMKIPVAFGQQSSDIHSQWYTSPAERRLGACHSMILPHFCCVQGLCILIVCPLRATCSMELNHLRTCTHNDKCAWSNPTTLSGPKDLALHYKVTNFLCTWWAHNFLPLHLFNINTRFCWNIKGMTEYNTSNAPRMVFLVVEILTGFWSNGINWWLRKKKRKTKVRDRTGAQQ